jgi:hypothetical protein
VFAVQASASLAKSRLTFAIFLLDGHRHSTGSPFNLALCYRSWFSVVRSIFRALVHDCFPNTKALHPNGSPNAVDID